MWDGTFDICRNTRPARLLWYSAIATDVAVHRFKICINLACWFAVCDNHPSVAVREESSLAVNSVKESSNESLNHSNDSVGSASDIAEFSDDDDIPAGKYTNGGYCNACVVIGYRYLNCINGAVVDGFIVGAASVAPSREMYKTVNAEGVLALGHVLWWCWGLTLVACYVNTLCKTDISFVGLLLLKYFKISYQVLFLGNCDGCKQICLECFDTLGWLAGRPSGL